MIMGRFMPQCTGPPVILTPLMTRIIIPVKIQTMP
jgi:hypothetical protein